MLSKIDIHPEIAKSKTLPSEVYRSPDYYERAIETVFKKSLQLVADSDVIKTPGQVYPTILLEHCLDEPLVFTRDFSDEIHCLSNVCTHRGNLVVEHPTHGRGLQCRYHGRRFQLDGKFGSMPEFEGVEDFPCEADNLPRVPFAQWRRFLFAGIEPAISFEEYIKPIEDRLFWLPIQDFVFDDTLSRDYLIKTNWALYCDNYLEGFHIPFVHPALNAVLDYGAYACETFDHVNLQIGITKNPKEAFDLPKESPDYGKLIAGYYFWLFPNLMLNFYPWGISINIVKPLAHNLTKVSYWTYRWIAAGVQRDESYSIDRVEREDEVVVEAVWKGVQSRLYNAGRYSVKREANVHHFHRLYASYLNGER